MPVPKNAQSASLLERYLKSEITLNKDKEAILVSRVSIWNPTLPGCKYSTNYSESNEEKGAFKNGNKISFFFLSHRV